MGVNLEKCDMIFIDTAPFIYFFEKNEKYFQPMSMLFDIIYDNDVQVVTSLITYIEITTHPMKLGNKKLASKYRDYFTNSENISLYPVNLLIAEEAVIFRSRYKMKTPDAIQLATAAVCGADYIVSNDNSWSKISDVPLVLIDDIAGD